jgi:hypothetical protein
MKPAQNIPKAEKQMAAKKPTKLGKLQVVDILPDKARSPQIAPRQRFLDAIDTQKRAFLAAEAGDHIYIKRGRKQTKVMHWWWERDGEYYITVRYGVATLPLTEAGHSTLRVGPRENIPAVLDQLKEVVEAGELDEALREAANKRSQARRGAGRKATDVEE